ALARVLDSGWYILGQQGEAFEREFAAWCGAAHGVGVGSRTDPLRIALLALGVQPGDEVITVANAGIPPVAAIVAVGARPVFADVTPTTHTLDPDQAATAITARTRALLVVHLYGHPADMDPLLALARQHGLLVLEDCAQAHGARYKGRLVGTLGHAAPFRSTPPRTSARSATPAWCSPRMPPSPSGRGCCATTAGGSSTRASCWPPHRGWT